ncbi:uncharacterized protein LOC111247810 isoform X1 [Varroa destructor]|uniref:Uncharacterized protein n=1 Tax=Varroa destructor TaxID=109461 RepID=A0A7M7M7A8_VARDE|nr:uncharacterized protein LOC111247810 isoform X1 [Varroa destructor]XP_022654960.1 uncharacterized protein LOC111247810 isoform X1 [Varroa destructor]XP_022654961.1 uncharacterized protein LOC111247810 isoform X1 [Varroa destructor]XP_022654962.1 uncharacterized protein LOC111247810 isoform X1 [Varroa destructor]XP_022654963.1 uncharacterized protein LOC111247810 isoform X1 [Varroa destructor]
MRNKPSSAMLLLVPLGLLQLYVQPQTHIQDGHLIGGHALTAATFLSRKPLQFASSRTYTTRRSPIYPGSVYSTAYGLNPSFQPDYRPNIAYNTAGQNELVQPVVLAAADPTSDEGRFTEPRVFFDDDYNEVSQVRRLEEGLREERLRQNLHQHPPGTTPVRETRRYEKSVEGDLDFSEDKKLKLAGRRKRDTANNTASSSTPGTTIIQPAATMMTIYSQKIRPILKKDTSAFQKRTPFQQNSCGRRWEQQP